MIIENYDVFIIWKGELQDVINDSTNKGTIKSTMRGFLSSFFDQQFLLDDANWFGPFTQHFLHALKMVHSAP